MQSLAPIPAGDFSLWLCQIRASLLGKGGMQVACGACVGCCISSYFIHIRPEEQATISSIPANLLFSAPGQPKGHLLIGYDTAGICPMFQERKCTIYEHRPRACRDYDCRIFTAAGITAGGDEKAVIDERVKRWVFSYPTRLDRDEHRAVMQAASFIQKHGCHFPGGHVPENPSQLAVLAIKAYAVFTGLNGMESCKEEFSCAEVAEAIVKACREFDSRMELTMQSS